MGIANKFVTVYGDPHATIEELRKKCYDLTSGILHKLISDHLKFKKLTDRYIHKHLTASQQVEQVRIYNENLAKFELRAKCLTHSIDIPCACE